MSQMAANESAAVKSPNAFPTYAQRIVDKRTRIVPITDDQAVLSIRKVQARPSAGAAGASGTAE
jgi:hypothetical protein